MQSFLLALVFPWLFFKTVGVLTFLWAMVVHRLSLLFLGINYAYTDPGEYLLCFIKLKIHDFSVV